jgi:hypothetical protein
MAATLHFLHPETPPIAGFLRIGHTGHRKLEAMLAAGRFPFKRVVFDAAHIDEQKELLGALRGRGSEIVLDPNFAEMAAAGRFASAVSKLPWSNPERPWQPSDFGVNRNLDVAKLIAEFAVSHGVNAVLSPTHLIDDTTASWRSTDHRLCEALRRELDRLGGNGIAIDYQVITTNALVKDGDHRTSLLEGINALPVENIWLRTSGFGATATGAGTRSYIEALQGFHQIGKPVVADYVGGFPGLAAAASGAVGGISHGVGQKEGFDANSWNHAPPSTRSGGSTVRVYIHELDRYLTEAQLEALFAARGGRSRLSCLDASCCPNGPEDMIENAHAHFITQRSRQIDDLSNVPESRRTEHFLLRHVDPAVRSSRQAARLRIVDEKVAKVVIAAKSRLIRLRDALSDLNEALSSRTRSRSPSFRGGSQAISAVLGIG